MAKKQDWTTRMPGYQPPGRELVRKALDMAERNATIKSPKLIAVETRRIIPREMIVLDQGLIDLMNDAPETVPPIVIAPWGDVHVVVDGHHRLAGAIEAGHAWIWAVEAPLVRLKTLVWPAWY